MPLTRHLTTQTVVTFLFLISAHLSWCQHEHRIEFHPSVYHRQLSALAASVLKISSGDTIYSESIDAGGFDKNGKKVSEGGNPLTGPFYIEGASKGDIVAVTLIDVSLNRNYATTFEVFVPRSLPKETIDKLWKKTEPVNWNLDLASGTASPNVKHEHLQDFSVPLHPFLGCVGLAPEGTGIQTFDAGPSGGNLDFSRITKSATIYLPVFHDGGLLFLGDAHAVQGDGELTGSALETSVDFVFTVNVIKSEAKISFPRIEDETYIMAIGLHKKLDEALRSATKNLLDWLQLDYQLSLKEATQVMGSSIEYRIAEIADPKTEVVAMIRKDILKGLKKHRWEF